MVTVLVVVNKKNVEKFRENYMSWLLNFYKEDEEKWQQRTRAMLKNNHNGEEKSAEEVDQIVEEEYQAELKKHQKMMQQPGVVPMSEKYLGSEDAEGNQLWRIIVMKEQAVDYVKVMKKNGFQGQ